MICKFQHLISLERSHGLHRLDFIGWIVWLGADEMIKISIFVFLQVQNLQMNKGRSMGSVGFEACGFSLQIFKENSCGSRWIAVELGG